ncbi:GNAT family N-acetyltransferase [Parasulfitobacter algicola]|uniref:GNAT family N-acetyltransferase n=1 Tax=Parasulfitobacter algicola TaxID=2614809 RepID=A0ABX2IZQ2_9RHOB|nr:GNAT family N-acetyltransferase [Sulfitobacter algicola]NSX56188.1 GNAT family N-acetyltransferase [Sulfitobacter algicola]
MTSDPKGAETSGFFPVTVALILAGSAAFYIWGPGGFAVPAAPLTDRFGMALANIFRHGTQMHLLGNMVLIGFAGYFIETRTNALFLITLAVVAAFVGTALELYLVDDRFVGLSGIAYAMAAFALCSPKKTGLNPVWALIIAGAAVFETVHQWSEIAVFVHIGGAVTGGVFAMLGGLFGGGGPRLKPMEFKHLRYVIDIINETDEDDAAEAEEDLLESQFANMFVLLERGNVLGVTGYSPIEDTDKAVWLSWTYLAKMHRGQGLGKLMVNDLLKSLADQGARKMFISTSDYTEDGVDIYADARAFYQSLGAFEELRVPAYHSADEAKIIYGLINSEAVPARAEDFPPAKGVTFTGAPQAPESEGGAALTWKEEGIGVNGLAEVIRKAQAGGARILVTSLPQDISALAAPDLEHYGFEKVGSLADYYAVGEAQDWWTYRLK